MKQAWIPAQPGHPEQVLFRPPERDGVLWEGDVLYRLGRDAIYHGLRALVEASPADSRRTVLVPSFHCSSQVAAAEAAGLRCEFFPVRTDASVDLEQLAARIHDDVLAVMVIHYYGWPLDLDGLIALARQRNVALFEDCALSLLSRHRGRPVGTVGDLAIFSLRKFLPVRDGGVLRLNRPGLTPERPARTPSSLRPAVGAVARAVGAGGLIRLGKRLLGRGNGGQGAGSLEEPAAPGAEPEPDFVVDQADQGISSFSRYVVRRIRPAEVVARRRRAYQMLRERLQEHPRFRPLFHELPDGVCPLSLVLVHPQRDEVEARLADMEVEAYCFGRVPHPRLDRSRFPETGVLCDQTFAIPAHQDLNDAQMERVADVVRRAL